MRRRTMMKNKSLTKGFVVVCCIAFCAVLLNAQTTTTIESFNTVIGALNTVKSEISDKRDSISQYFTLRVEIKTLLKENKEDQRDNVIDALGGEDSALIALGKSIMDSMDGRQLMEEMDHVNKSIEDFINTEIDKKIYQRKANSSTLTMRGYNQLFDLLQTTYANLSPEDRSIVNHTYFDTTSNAVFDLKKSSIHKPVPNPATVFLVRCGNPSGRCYGYYDKADKHKKICPHKHGVIGETNKVWWSCFDDFCTHDKYSWSLWQHWEPCRGGCEESCPAPLSPPPLGHGAQGIGRHATTIYYDHEEICQVPVYKNFIVGRQPCGRKYFTCQICRHGVKEGFFDNSTSFSAYGTYRAEVVYNDPIREVYWYFQKPGGSMKQVSHDTSGGKTSSWSHTFDSTSGTYKVKSTVYFKGSRPKITHERNVYVY